MQSANKSRLPNLDNTMMTKITRVSADTSGEVHNQKSKYARPTVRTAERSANKASAKTNAEMMRRIKKEVYVEKDTLPIFKGFLVSIYNTNTSSIACEATNENDLILLRSFTNNTTIPSTKENYILRSKTVGSNISYQEVISYNSIPTNLSSDLALNINNENIYIAQETANNIFMIEKESNGQTAIKQMINLPVGSKPSRIAVDNTNNDVYVVDNNNNFLMRYEGGTIDQVATKVADISPNATGIVVGDYIYICYPTSIDRITMEGDVAPWELNYPFADLADITIDKDGIVFVTEGSTANILSLNPKTNQVIDYDYFEVRNPLSTKIGLSPIRGLTAMRNNALFFYAIEGNSRVVKLELIK